jgi:hypothetical protein
VRRLPSAEGRREQFRAGEWRGGERVGRVARGEKSVERGPCGAELGGVDEWAPGGGRQVDQGL